MTPTRGRKNETCQLTPCKTCLAGCPFRTPLSEITMSVQDWKNDASNREKKWNLPINTLQNVSCKLPFLQAFSIDNNVCLEFEKWCLRKGEKMKRLAKRALQAANSAGLFQRKQYLPEFDVHCLRSSQILGRYLVQNIVDSSMDNGVIFFLSFCLLVFLSSSLDCRWYHPV